MSLFNFFKKNETPEPQKDYYTQETIKLPDDFAQRVMQLQMQTEFEQSCEIQVIHELNELYKLAIEYYSTTDIKKVQHFQRKLTALLTNPNTIDVIEQKQVAVKTSHIDSKGYEKNLKHELHMFNSQSNIMVKSMIEGTDKKIEHHNRLMNNNLEKQEDSLQRRLMERSKSKSRKRI